MKKKLKQKKEFNLFEEYKKSWKYIKESKKFIYLSIGIFSFFLFIGYFIPAPEFISKEIMKFFREIIEQIQDMSQYEIIEFIISNNVRGSFLIILFGVLFGLFPIISTISNGYLLGFSALLAVKSGGILAIWNIFPYGIFELPAIFISLGIGIKLGTFIFQKKKLDSFVNYLINSLRIFLLIIVPLLIIAGIIEGTLIFIMLINP